MKTFTNFEDWSKYFNGSNAHIEYDKRLAEIKKGLNLSDDSFYTIQDRKLSEITGKVIFTIQV